MNITLDRRRFIEGLGGVAAVSLMTHEARADALEEALNAELQAVQTRTAEGLRVAGSQAAPTSDTEPRQRADAQPAQSPTAEPLPAASSEFPTAADVYAQIPTRQYRRGVGVSFLNTQPGGTVAYLPPMPAAPTLLDFFELRFTRTRNHCYQSAKHALDRGVDEQVVLACLLHDVIQEIMRTDHGYWGAQLFEPYVPARTMFAIKYHQALRFYADEAAGYEYPDLYRRIFGYDYVPAPHVHADYERVRRHRWYDAPRAVTVSDLYAFDPDAVVSMEPFVDIVGRHFKQPKEGLGNDNSAVAHMWRTIANPDAPL